MLLFEYIFTEQTHLQEHRAESGLNLMIVVSRLVAVCFFCCVTTVSFVAFLTRGLPAKATSEQAASIVMR